METWQILVIAVFLAAIAAAWLNGIRERKEEERRREADIRLNPQNYYVSEGGLIPDPIEEETEEANTSNSGS